MYPFFPQVQQSTSLGFFLGFAEEDPDAGLNASLVGPEVALLVGPVGFDLFEIWGGLLFLGQQVGRGRGALHVIRFVKALSMRVSEGSSSTDTSSPFT